MVPEPVPPIDCAELELRIIALVVLAVNAEALLLLLEKLPLIEKSILDATDPLALLIVTLLNTVVVGDPPIVCGEAEPNVVVPAV